MKNLRQINRGRSLVSVLRGAVRGFSEEARTRGFPSPSLDGFGFICVSVALSIVGAWRNGSRSLMTALGQKRPLNSIQILASEWLLSGYTGHSPLNSSGGCFRPIAVIRGAVATPDHDDAIEFPILRSGSADRKSFRSPHGRRLSFVCPNPVLGFGPSGPAPTLRRAVEVAGTVPYQGSRGRC